MQLRRRPRVETLCITPVGADGPLENSALAVGLGKQGVRSVDLPAGTRSIRIERPVRERVDLGQVRRSRHRAPSVRRTWRNAGAPWLHWDFWLSNRRPHRRQRP